MPSALRIEPHRAGDRMLVTMVGSVDESVELGALDALAGPVEIDLSGVRRFNSVGIREWIQAFRTLTARARVTCVACSPTVIHQLNMITGFLGEAQVRSFYAPMLCPACDTSHEQLLDRSAVDGFEPAPCPRCRTPLELDEDEEQYLLFLREPTRVEPA
jgi:anti-anti-sigma regulatory factor